MAESLSEERIEEEEEELHEDEEVPSDKDKKIFINYVDSYHGKHIARVSVFD